MKASINRQEIEEIERLRTRKNLAKITDSPTLSYRSKFDLLVDLYLNDNIGRIGAPDEATLRGYAESTARNMLSS